MARPDPSKSPASPAADFARKGCSSLFFSIFAIAGFAFLGAFVYSFFNTLGPYFWTKTPCTIVEAYRPQQGVEQTDKREFVIRYRYTVRGEQHTSDVFIRGAKESLNASKIERLLIRYQPGTRADCYVNEKKPEEAALQRGELWVMVFVFIPLIFIAVGVGGVIGVWRKTPWKPRIPTKRKAQLGKFAPVFFFGLFALVGGLLGYFVTVKPALLFYDARSWPEVPCEILSSKVGVHSDSDGSTYSIDVEYRYTVDGREYRSDRYDIFGGSSSGRKGKEDVVAQYPSGSKAICFVNPKDPTEAMLDRKPSLFWLIGLIPGLFFIVGIGGIFGTLRSALKSSGGVKLPGTSSTPSIPGVPILPPTMSRGVGVLTSGGTMELASSASPLTKLAGAMFICVFWNGITGVFVWFAAQSWIKGKPEIFLTLFITPFVLIGLALIGGVGYTLLNLFNPRVRLTISDTSPALGGKINLGWQFSGAVGRLQSLKIQLEGREEARYRRGTDTVIDRHVFFRIPVFETSDPRLIAQGQAQFTVPENLMHTWDGGNNKIVWELKLRGDIPRFPDVHEEYPMTILPRSI